MLKHREKVALLEYAKDILEREKGITAGRDQLRLVNWALWRGLPLYVDFTVAGNEYCYDGSTFYQVAKIG